MDDASLNHPFWMIITHLSYSYISKHHPKVDDYCLILYIVSAYVSKYHPKVDDICLIHYYSERCMQEASKIGCF